MVKKQIKKILNTIDNKLYKFIIGKPISPPLYTIKRQTIENYAKEFSIDIFIETGTFLGETVEALKNKFKKLISIELDKDLYKKSKEKFIYNTHITILQGDSSDILKVVTPTLYQPTLFWLDGHYSGGITARGNLNTPILKELEIILNHRIKNHIILIDDARCFTGENEYPTVKELFSFIKKINSNINFKVSNDIIRIVPCDNIKYIKSKSYKEPFRQKASFNYRKIKKILRKIIYAKN
ncbi:MAG: hypothetical protein V1851_01425 [Patescibacteria group bacterium]